MVTLQMGHSSKVLKRVGNAQPVAQVALEGEALLVQPRRPLGVALHLGQNGQAVERPGHPTLVAQTPRQPQTLLLQGRRSLGLAPVVGQPSSRMERLRPRRDASGALTSGYRQRLIQPLLALTQMAMCGPEPPERPTEAQGQLHLPARQRPAQGGTQVVVLLLEPSE